jgi:hypothetical protein
MTQVLRVLGRILKWLAIAVATLVIAVFAINSFDEKLTPGAEALLRLPPNPYSGDENAYLWIMGFDAPTEESVVAAGEARVTDGERRALLMRTDPVNALKGWTDPDRRRLTFDGPVHFCVDDPPGDWHAFEERHATLPALLASNRELIERYGLMLAKRGYFETGTHRELVTPGASLPSDLRCLFRAEIVERLHSGSPTIRDSALAMLARDVALWRVILSGTGGITSKIVASRMIRGDLLIVADMIADSASPLPEPSAIGSDLVDVFPIRDWNIGSAFLALTRERATSFPFDSESWDVHEAPGEQSGPVKRAVQFASLRLQQHFFKHGATLNLLARLNAEQVLLASADPSTFDLSERSYRDWCERNLGISSTFLLFDPAGWFVDRSRAAPPSFLYNPLGKALVSIGSPSESGFIRAVYDDAALQRLVRLGYEIRRQRVASELIPTFMRDHPEWSTHPVGNQPFVWNAGDRTIAVVTVSRFAANKRYWIKVWRPPATRAARVS